MDSKIYILKLKICGIKNIERPIEIEFYKKTINRDFNPDKYKIKAIYGENGSGKTAIISSVKLLQNLLLNKSYLADTDNQNFLIEIVNKKTKKGFVQCEVYVDDGDEKYVLDYYIAFEVREDNRFYITAEKLKLKNGNYSKNKYSIIYETKNGSLVKFGDKKMHDFFKEKSQNLLDKQTFFTCIVDIKFIPKEFMNNKDFIMLFLLFIFALSLLVSIDEADNHADYGLRQKLQNIDEGDIEKTGLNLINQINQKILSAKGNEMLIHKSMYNLYEKKIFRMYLFIQIFKPELCAIEIEKKDYDQYYKCSLKMVYEEYSLDQEFESRGIKKLMNLFHYLDAASDGSIVFIDELDSNINDVYLDKIIEFFVYYGKGQLCFTSHNLSPMSVLKSNKNAINFISGINTVHTWTTCGNLSPENAYKKGFIEDSPFNVDASDFLGILGGSDE